MSETLYTQGFRAGQETEQERIIKLINDTAGEICGNSVHIINGSCLCDLIARIKGENK
jgi:hypothetical protein